MSDTIKNVGGGKMKYRKVLNSIFAIAACLNITVFSNLAVINAENTATPTPISTAAPTAIQMYRLYNPNSGEHFYTKDETEKNNLYDDGWGYEGIGWEAPSAGDPVYRLYNAVGGEHHYTLDASERDMLVRNGWNYESIGWYSSTDKKYTLYRQYNPNQYACNHNYTLSTAERDSLISKGWHDEGIAWYAFNGNSAPQDVQYKEIPVVFVTPPYYCQNDPEWGGANFGGYTIGYTGCGVTSLAMIFSARLNTTITPYDMANVLYNAGEYNNMQARSGYAGTNGASHIAAANYWGLPCSGIGSEAELEYDLSKGKLISFQCVGAPFCNYANASHDIVVFRTADGATNVYDPLGQCTGTYSPEDIWNHMTTVATDLDMGVPGFAF
jgi:hypothetical protein